MNYHPLLIRQLEKCFPPGAALPANCEGLFELISATYSNAAANNLSPEDPASKIAALEAALDRASEAAEQAALAKGGFLSIMSHEIRTSLNTIIGIAHLMMNENLPHSQLDNIRTLHISADNLLNLVDDIVDFNKIEEGRLRLQPGNTDLRQLLNNVKLANRLRAEERGNIIRIQFDHDLPRFVIADERRLTQVLNNLVSNAVKFTRNGQVTIEVSRMGGDADLANIRFSVNDTGVGVSREKQQLLLSPANASPEKMREPGTAGLGLPITRRLLALMKSEIAIESPLGQGASFYFTLLLPIGQELPVAENQSSSTPGQDLSGINVLLVEDVEFNVMVAEKILSNWNARVDVAENGLHAIGKVREGNFDIILMDLQMPVLDGYSATRHIREFNPRIPIIALSASASPDIQDRTREAGMNGYLSKPFKPADLYETIYRFTIKEKLA